MTHSVTEGGKPINMRKLVEERARELCEADGRNPDAVDWMGDPDVIGGTYSWEIWREYELDAEAQIKAELAKEQG